MTAPGVTGAPVDVLAVMDDAINNILIPNGGAYVESMEEARAAVAELIEADREYDRVRVAPYNRHDPIAAREAREEFLAAQERRRAALARVGGAG